MLLIRWIHKLGQQFFSLEIPEVTDALDAQIGTDFFSVTRPVVTDSSNVKLRPQFFLMENTKG